MTHTTRAHEKSRRRRARRLLAAAVAAASGIGATTAPAAAHVGALSESSDPGTIPLWLVLVTGGALVAASFLFTAFVTSRRDIYLVAELSATLPVPGSVARTVGAVAGGVGVAALAAVVASGLFGVSDPNANLAVLLVWSGWWAGYTMSVYLVGNTWPLVNPWRAISGWLPDLGRAYPERLGAWPAVAGLLGLVSLEVISPLATAPRLLAAVVVAYTAATLAGAVVFGTETWFGTVDPVSRVFRLYGRMAPVGTTDARPTDDRTSTPADAPRGATDGGSRGLAISLPGARLCLPERPLRPDETAFVVALLWVTTFDGLVTTPAWNAVARPVGGAGVPAPLLYLVGIVAGFGLFLWAYRTAAGLARETADTYVTARYLGGWFAGALLPIAAGYHLAHFLGYFLQLLPSLAEALATPLSASGPPVVYVMPEWFGILQLAFVVGGHLLAVWVAHSAAFRLFSGAIQPLRSQYPFVIVMVGYTVVSMWIISQPYVDPVFT